MCLEQTPLNLSVSVKIPVPSHRSVIISFDHDYEDPWFEEVTKFGILLNELIGTAIDGILCDPVVLATDAGARVADECMAAI
jgi:hypothetical protein